MTKSPTQKKVIVSSEVVEAAGQTPADKTPNMEVSPRGSPAGGAGVSGAASPGASHQLKQRTRDA